MECKDTKNIKCLNILGEGSSSAVYKVKYKNKISALKKNKNVQESIRELEILKKIQDSCKTKNLICIVGQENGDIILEYNKGIDFFSYYKKNRETKNFKKEVIFFIKKLKDAIDYLHSQKIIHFDIKPENILVTKKNLKLIDYGGSVIYKSKPIKQIYYTPEYNSDEKFKNLSFAHSKYKDWFSFFRTFRNDIKNVISPLVFCEDPELYGLFDTKDINTRNYKSRLKKIWSYIGP